MQEPENNVCRKIFILKRDKVSGQFRMVLHKNNFRGLCREPNVVGGIKSII
jgi:hypothetical protein